VYAVDMIGMGCSGKPEVDYSKMTTEEVLAFYSDSIHQSVQALGLNQFHLVAHSMGAYLCFYYLMRYPKDAKTFSAISPAGMTTEPLDFSMRIKKAKLPFKSKFLRWFWLFMNKGYVKGYTAFSWLPTGWFIRMWSDDRFEFEGREKKALLDLIVAGFLHPGFSVDILPKIFGYRTYSAVPVCDFLHEVERTLPVMHVFGELDWIDKHSFNKFVDESKLG
jgi:cardiolipin-specific phospholipase